MVPIAVLAVILGVASSSGSEWELTYNEVVVGRFKGVNGLSVGVSDTAYDDDAPEPPTKKSKIDGVTLLQGHTTPSAHEWYSEVCKGDAIPNKLHKRNLVLTQLSFGIPITSWRLSGSLPIYWKPTHNSRQDVIATDEMVFAVDDLHIV
eukprot:TRINITY_DN10893_c0_g1_i1.p1 TRINITY_DN10893_c0_g1~~TRINITY_DN10893_c0_g1_i1.p1  ORF type:complete len:149 (+),score=17.46 TRINITY_DN10893_c0_g1_i1:54-500(+)